MTGAGDRHIAKVGVEQVGMDAGSSVDQDAYFAASFRRADITSPSE
jgi:hypothetical protein